MKLKRNSLIILFIFGFFLPVQTAFSEKKIITSRYFSIHLTDSSDLEKLTTQLSVPPNIRSTVAQTLSLNVSNSLGQELDTLFLAISAMLDLHVQNFKIKIIICHTAQELSDIAKKLLGKETSRQGFFISEHNTIYINAENASLYILGHELTHAIQNAYFILPPPEKIQEVLSGYVEFQLRKYTINKLNNK